jgi:hypothetical protein
MHDESIVQHLLRSGLHHAQYVQEVRRVRAQACSVVQPSRRDTLRCRATPRPSAHPLQAGVLWRGRHFAHATAALCALAQVRGIMQVLTECGYLLPEHVDLMWAAIEKVRGGRRPRSGGCSRFVAGLRVLLQTWPLPEAHTALAACLPNWGCDAGGHVRCCQDAHV